jgi:hypothetical protein
MKAKAFDCVEMKREGARRVYEKTRGMTHAEEIAFWRKRTLALRRRQRSLTQPNSRRAAKSKA